MTTSSVTWAYVRVSTVKQITDRQVDAIERHGYDKLIEDKVSGAKFDRAGLNTVLEHSRAGDVVVVASIDRLGRNLYESIGVAKQLHEKGVTLKSLKEGIDYSDACGRMIAHIFGAIAEREREVINERAAEARAAAAARGKQTGRPKALTGDQVRQLKALHAAGESVPDLVKSFKVSRATVYRVLDAQPVSVSL